MSTHCFLWGRGRWYSRHRGLPSSYLEEDALLQSELLHGLGRGEVDLAGDGAALEDRLRHAGLMLDVRQRPV